MTVRQAENKNKVPRPRAGNPTWTFDEGPASELSFVRAIRFPPDVGPISPNAKFPHLSIVRIYPALF